MYIVKQCTIMSLLDCGQGHEEVVCTFKPGHDEMRDLTRLCCVLSTHILNVVKQMNILRNIIG